MGESLQAMGRQIHMLQQEGKFAPYYPITVDLRTFNWTCWDRTQDHPHSKQDFCHYLITEEEAGALFMKSPRDLVISEKNRSNILPGASQM